MRDVIFIVGAGRSGTSALARALSLCGAALPLRLMPANFANPTGYWEPQLAVDINELFLRAHHSSWHDPRVEMQLKASAAADSGPLIERAVAFFMNGFEPRGPLVVKEPRISALLPYWVEAATKAGLRPTVIHNFRHPQDVVASLVSRDAISPDHCDALWLKYNLVAERDARGLARIFVSYEDLMDDWRSVVAHCTRGLGVSLSTDAGAAHGIDTFLSRGLRHAESDRASFAENADPLIVQTYALLMNARSATPDEASFDGALARYAARPRAAGGQG